MKAVACLLKTTSTTINSRRTDTFQVDRYFTFLIIPHKLDNFHPTRLFIMCGNMRKSRLDRDYRAASNKTPWILTVKFAQILPSNIWCEPGALLHWHFQKNQNKKYLEHLHKMWAKVLIKPFFCRHSNDGYDWRHHDLRFLPHVYLRSTITNHKKGIITSIAPKKSSLQQRAFSGINDLAGLNNLQHLLESTVWNTDKGSNIQRYQSGWVLQWKREVEGERGWTLCLQVSSRWRSSLPDWDLNPRLPAPCQ